MVQMAILDGKEYASLQDGRNQMESEVQRCVLLSNNQVLVCAQAGLHARPLHSTLARLGFTLSVRKDCLTM